MPVATAARYRNQGACGIKDQTSRPRTTPTRTERRVTKVRVLRRWGPALGLNPSTAHRILTRYRLAHLDRATGRPIRRCEHPAPGD